MHDHALRVLEYDRLKGIVAEFAVSEAGKCLINGLRPLSEPDAVMTLLGETRELMQVLEAGERPPLDGIADIRQAAAKLEAGGSLLSPDELWNTASTLAAGRRIKKFFERFDGRGEAFRLSAPFVTRWAAKIRPLEQFENAIFAAISEKREVKDSASQELRKIRRHIVRMREEILRGMNRILQDGGMQKIVQEPVITLRDDRYVLPLKPNFRQSLQGVVHGQSSSRATLFVEPLEVLEQNNRLAELRIEETAEIERILRELTAFLSEDSQSVIATVDALAAIDAIYARAQFGIVYSATVPDLSNDRSIELRSARHPLLLSKYKHQAQQAAVTPNDILVGSGQRALILSGPNAGGKTVILKTTGLLCLMAQSGLPVTAREGSRLPCFREIYADIGDEQSLEQDLSTFSSHVRRIAEILDHAGPESLVLLDELGSGTEPGEGGGLAAAVLETLIDRGCVTIVTTHHNALKLFASETSGAVNAAMEFDPQTLKPTYRLIPGRPGRSYGLDMAARMGIPATVIQKARTRISEDDISLDQLLKQVEADARVIAAERRTIERERADALRMRSDADQALRSARDEAGEVKAKARAEAKEVLTELRRRLQELTRAVQIDRAEAKQRATAAEAAMRSLATQPPDTSPAVGQGSRRVRAGDTVRIERINKTGSVLSLQGDRLELDVDGKKVMVSAAEAVPIERKAGRAATRTPGWSTELQDEEQSSDRINIIGLRVPEGLAEVDRLVDRAAIHHLSFVTIIHGLGTGALKQAVTDLLQHHPLVASIRQGEPAEGGAGVTIAELKK